MNAWERMPFDDEEGAWSVDGMRVRDGRGRGAVECDAITCRLRRLLPSSHWRPRTSADMFKFNFFAEDEAVAPPPATADADALDIDLEQPSQVALEELVSPPGRPSRI